MLASCIISKMSVSFVYLYCLIVHTPQILRFHIRFSYKKNPAGFDVPDRIFA